MKLKIEMDDWPIFLEKFRKDFKGFFRNQVACDMVARAIWEFGNSQWKKATEKEKGRMP